jgi:hypothetical protein
MAGPDGPVGNPPRCDWVQQATFGQGSSGLACLLCGADDYGKSKLTHRDGCPAERFPTRRELFAAVALGPSLNIVAAADALRREQRERGTLNPELSPHSLWLARAEAALDAALGFPGVDAEVVDNEGEPSMLSLAREDVEELVGRAFAGMAVANLDAEDCALLARVLGAREGVSW